MYEPNWIIHHINIENPISISVHILKKLNRLCPPDRPHNAFYLCPLKSPTQSHWFSCVPVGPNKLANIFSTMCKLAWIGVYLSVNGLATTAQE